MPIRPNAGVRALTLLSLFIKRIRFAHDISRVYPFTDAPHHQVYNWDYSLKNDISKHDYCKNGYRLFHHSIEHQLVYETCHRRWRQLSRLEAATIRFSQWQKPNTIEILSPIRFLQVNWAQSSVGEPTINDAIIPLNRLYEEPKAKLKDTCESAKLRLHPFESSKVHRLQLACTPTTLATSRKLGGQQHQRHFW